MARGKIDPVKLRRLVRLGRTQRQIAKEFNVSDSAIHQRLKSLNINLAKCVQLESGHAVLLDALDSAGQLFKINQDALYILDLLMGLVKGEDWAIKLLKKHNELETTIKFQDPKVLALQAMRELRCQIKLQNEILDSVANFEAVASFQKEIIEIIGQMDLETRKKFINKLRERKSLRSAVRFG